MVHQNQLKMTNIKKNRKIASSYLKKSLILLILSTLLIVEGESQTLSTCHYTCQTCTSLQYYQCLSCHRHRGSYSSLTAQYQPISGMCYCESQTDQDQLGICQVASSYNQTSQAIISVFIASTMFFGFIMALIRGMRYYLLKIVEDLQEISLIILINLYFPQQFDEYLAHLYRFNISSFAFQLFTADSVQTEHVYGKYKLLGKTSNFLGNCLAWMIMSVSIMIFVVLIRTIRKSWKKKVSSEVQVAKNIPVQILTENVQTIQQGMGDQLISRMREKNRLKSQESTTSLENSTSYKILNRLNNSIWLNLPILFFYFSLLDLNINIFTQLFNMTFSSTLSAVGSILSIGFLILELILCLVLLLKVKMDAEKHLFHLFLSNQDQLQNLDKIFLFHLLQQENHLFPVSSILAISCVQAVYLLTAIYCQPLERRYLRIHFYLTEGFKLLMSISLLTFSAKYAYNKHLVDITQILYIIMAFIFGFHLFWILGNLIIEWKVYWFVLRNQFEHFCGGTSKVSKKPEEQNCTLGIFDFQLNQNSKQQQKQIKLVTFNGKSKVRHPFEDPKIGYHSEGRMYIFEKY